MEETLKERLNEVFEIAQKKEKPFEFLREAIDHLFDIFLAKAQEKVEPTKERPQSYRHEVDEKTGEIKRINI